MPFTAPRDSQLEVQLSSTRHEGATCTQIQVAMPNVAGLLASLASRLASLGCDVLSSNGGAAGPEKQKHMNGVFYVQVGGTAIPPSSYPALEQALHSTCDAVVRAARPKDLFTVSFAEDPKQPSQRSLVTVRGPDVPSLLNAIASTLQSALCSIVTIAGEKLEGGESSTTAVVQREGGPVHPDEHWTIRCRLLEACSELLLKAERMEKATPDTSLYRIAVSSATLDPGQTSTSVTVTGPDIPGLFSRLTSALAADGYTVVSFSAAVDGNTASGVSADDGSLVEDLCSPAITRSPSTRRPSFNLKPSILGSSGAMSTANSSASHQNVSTSQGPSADRPSESRLRWSEFSRRGTVKDVFHILKNGRPLTDHESALLQKWLTEQCDQYFLSATEPDPLLQRKDAIWPQLTPSRATSAGSSLSTAIAHPVGDSPPSVGSSPPSVEVGGARATRMKASVAGSSSAAGKAHEERPRGWFQRLLMGLLGGSSTASSKTEGDGSLLAKGGSATAAEAVGVVAMTKGSGGQGAHTRHGERVGAVGEANLSRVEPAKLETPRDCLHAIPPQMARARIRMTDLEVGKLLGSGAFGEVRKCHYLTSAVAVKRLAKKDELSVDAIGDFVRECDLCLSLRHPNIVQMYGAAWEAEPFKLYMVMELCRGTLADALADTKADLKWTVRVDILIGIARGMAYLHTQDPPVVHRDLKPENVLLAEGRHFHPKVSDFGASGHAAQHLNVSMLGTPFFAAPEVLSRKPHDDRTVDQWSFGCVLACLYQRALCPYPLELINGVQSSRSLVSAICKGTLCPSSAHTTLPPNDPPVPLNPAAHPL